VLSVDLDGSRRIWLAHVGRLVDLDGSRPVLSDRLDDQTDDQVPSAENRRQGEQQGSSHQIWNLMSCPQGDEVKA
jgi:hypothetical protein